MSRTTHHKRTPDKPRRAKGYIPSGRSTARLRNELASGEVVGTWEPTSHRRTR